jgi:ParB-like chromosome segregation protein Spo0J
MTATIVPQRIEHLPLDALVPYARNSRTHSPEQIAQVAASIREFGFTNPVLIDAQGGIIAGHGRVMAARQLGLAEVPCIRLPHLTDAQKRAYIIADNKLALNAGWDDELLALELRDLDALGFDLDLTGFADDEISKLLDLELGEGEGEGQGDADAVPQPPAEPISRPGDVWVLGRHRVMCGDSTSIDQAGVLMGGGHG